MPVFVQPKTLPAFALCLFLLTAILLTACPAERQSILAEAPFSPLNAHV